MAKKDKKVVEEVSESEEEETTNTDDEQNSDASESEEENIINSDDEDETLEQDTEELFNKLTKNTKLRFVVKNSKKVTIDGKQYPNYKKDDKGMPLKYDKKEFKTFIDTNNDVLSDGLYVVGKVTLGLELGKNKKTKDPRAIIGTREFETDSGEIIEISSHLPGRIKNYLVERNLESAKIFNTKFITKTKPRKADLRVYGAEWVEFFRKGAQNKQFGTKEGVPADESTKESQLLLPSTREKQKSLYPHLFGYADGFKNLCVVKSGFIQKFVHYYFSISGAKNKNADGDKTVSVTVDGKKREIKTPTYKIPELMRETMPKHLKEVEEKSNKAAAADEAGTKQYYSARHFSNNLVLALCQAGKDKGVEESKADIKELKKKTGAVSLIVNEHKPIVEVLDDAKKDRVEKKKEEDKTTKKKKSTKEKKSVKKERSSRRENDPLM